MLAMGSQQGPTPLAESGQRKIKALPFVHVGSAGTADLDDGELLQGNTCFCPNPLRFSLPWRKQMYTFPKSLDKPPSCVLWQIICTALLNPLKKETLAFCLLSRGRYIYHRSSVRILAGGRRECLEIPFDHCLSCSPLKAPEIFQLWAYHKSKLLNISRISDDKIGM